MVERTKQCVDSESGLDHVQTVADAPRAKVQVAADAYQKLVIHRDKCDGSCMAGVNCDEAVRLQRAWRDAKNEAMA